MSFLLVDRLTTFSDPHSLSGIKHVSNEEHYTLLSDWDARRVWMPTLIGETIGQLAAWYAMQALDFQYRPVAGVVDRVEVFANAQPGDSVVVKADIDQLDEQAIHYQGTAWVGEICLMRIHHALGPMMPMASLISEEQVRWQYQQLEDTLSDAPLADSQLPATAKQLLLPEQDVRPPYTGACYDRVFDLKQDQGAYGQKLVSRSASYLVDHFPRKPVLPMTMLMQANHQLAATYLQAYYPSTMFELTLAQKVKMNQFVSPGQVVTTQMKVTDSTSASTSFQFKSFVGKQRVAVMQLVYGVCDV